MRWSKWEFNQMPVLYLYLFMLMLLHQRLCFGLNSEGLALLKFRESVVRDPFNALSNWKVGEDGDSDTLHCSWFGVHCSDSKVVILNLKDLCLEGTLAPELGNLAHIKSIILRNNVFTGIIPTAIGDLKKLEVVDLGFNNLSGRVPSNFRNNLSLSTLLLDNNKYLGGLSPELNQLHVLSKYQVNKDQLRSTSVGSFCNSRLLSWRGSQSQGFMRRKLLQLGRVRNRSRFRGRRSGLKVSTLSSAPAMSPSPSHSPHPSPLPSPSASVFRVFRSRSKRHSPSPSPAFAPSPSPLNSPSPSPVPVTSPSPSPLASVPAPAPVTVASANPSVSSSPPALAQAARVPVSTQSPTSNGPRSTHHTVIIWSSVAGASAFFIVLSAAIYICWIRKATVKPWATGLSGQLQKAFVSGVPKLKRSELELACEDFSNIIGSLTDGTVYKGTLSSGVEIAVVSTTVKSGEEWSRHLENQFRKKIETLSKVNHKNFVNLIGFCEEEKPFTRMMVFEYAPNGTLFEHLHIKEAERLEWGMRLRIIMGMAYYLEHVHQLDPPILHRDLQSSAIYLSEDYAAKMSDFSFWNATTGAKMRSPSLQLLEATLTDIETNVFNFGVVLLEIITGRIPYMEDNCTLTDWVLDCVDKDCIPEEFIDPTLSSFREDEVQRLFYIIRDCLHPDPTDRPTMREVASRLRQITGMGPESATPKLSPLWWAELEVLSTEAN